MLQPVYKTLLLFFKKKLHLTRVFNSLPMYILKKFENIGPIKNSHMTVHNSIIHNCQN